MDWKRAKTILILMFLVINTFLSYQLIAANRNQYKYTSADELVNIQEFLSKKNIKLETQIPDSVPVIPSLRVKYNSLEIEKVKKLFFSDKEYKVTKLNDGYAITSGDISVEVKNGIYLTYKNQDIKIKQGEVRKERCLSHIDKFVEDLKVSTGSKYTKVSEIKNGYMHVVFGQQYKKIPVESSQIEIIATEDGVVEAKVNWFEWIKVDRKLNITTPVVALLRAFESRNSESAPINVLQIKQGYYFNIDRQADSQEGVPLEGTVFPMWVVESDKSKIYINAYNEKFEKVQ